jgi:hypothetical protein
MEHDTQKRDIAHAMAEGHEETAAWILENWPKGFMPCAQCSVFWPEKDLPEDRICPHCVEENNDEFEDG